MSIAAAPPAGDDPVFSLPARPVGYVAIFAAVGSAAVHLFLGPHVIGLDAVLGTLFYLNALGMVGGVLLFLSRYWRRPFYLVAVGYALLTVAVFVALGGQLNAYAITAKTAEVVLAGAAAYLYATDAPGRPSTP